MEPLVIECSELYLLLPNKHIFLCHYQSRTFPSRTCCQLIVSRDKWRPLCPWNEEVCQQVDETYFLIYSSHSSVICRAEQAPLLKSEKCCLGKCCRCRPECTFSVHLSVAARVCCRRIFPVVFLREGFLVPSMWRQISMVSNFSNNNNIIIILLCCITITYLPLRLPDFLADRQQLPNSLWLCSLHSPGIWRSLKMNCGGEWGWWEGIKFCSQTSISQWSHPWGGGQGRLESIPADGLCGNHTRRRAVIHMICWTYI